MPDFTKAVKTFGFYVEEVNKRANGELRIDWIGGPEIIGPFEQARAVQSGAIDISSVPSTFYWSQVPEAFVLPFSRTTPDVERARGLDDYLLKVHKENLNAYFLGRTMFQYKFYMATSFPISSPQELKGHAGAGGGVLVDYMEALGMTVVETEEEYTAMERGLVDTLFMPAIQYDDMSLFELATHFIDHGLHTGSVATIMNLDKFNSLPKHLQDLLVQTQLDMEPMMVERGAQWTADGKQAARDAGLEIVTFSPEDAEYFVELIYDVGWAKAKEALSPESYVKMQAFLAAE